MTFETVTDAKKWLKSEEPNAKEVKEELQDEREREAGERVTATRAFESYLDELDDGEDEQSDGDTAFRVTGEVEGYVRGEIVYLDPSDDKVQRWRRENRINLWLG